MVPLEAHSRPDLIGLVPASGAGEDGESIVQSDVRTIDLATVEHHLSAGERIAWVGRSDPAKHFTRADGGALGPPGGGGGGGRGRTPGPKAEGGRGSAKPRAVADLVERLRERADG